MLFLIFQIISIQTWSIFDDLVYPVEIVGKRIRYRLDDTRLFKFNRPFWILNVNTKNSSQNHLFF